MYFPFVQCKGNHLAIYRIFRNVWTFNIEFYFGQACYFSQVNIIRLKTKRYIMPVHIVVKSTRFGAAPSDLDSKKIPPFWTGCPCRLRENWVGSSGAGFDIEDMGTVLGTVPRSSSSLPPLLSSRWAFGVFWKKTGHTLLRYSDEVTEAVHSQLRMFEERHKLKRNNKSSQGHADAQHTCVVFYNSVALWDI